MNDKTMLEQRLFPETNPDGTLKHIIKEGARYHVIGWSNLGRWCSEPNCEVNRNTRATLGQTLPPKTGA